MNGRIYDYNVGRFLGVDPFLQFPENSQSANPYSYIMNNPMSGTDPTGYEKEEIEEVNGGVVTEHQNEDKIALENGQRNEVKTANRDSRSANKVGTFAGTSGGVNNGSDSSFIGAIKRVAQKLIASQAEGFLAYIGDPNAAVKGEAIAEHNVPIEGDAENDGANIVNASPAIGAVIVAGQFAVTKGRSLPNDLQNANIKRMRKKVPANSKENMELHDLPDGGVAVQFTSPGKVPGSKAVYEKQVDKNGKTIDVTKTTYDPDGNIVHVKNKM